MAYTDTALPRETCRVYGDVLYDRIRWVRLRSFAIRLQATLAAADALPMRVRAATVFLPERALAQELAVGLTKMRRVLVVAALWTGESPRPAYIEAVWERAIERVREMVDFTKGIQGS